LTAPNRRFYFCQHNKPAQEKCQVGKTFPKIPDPLEDVPRHLRKRWRRLKKHYPKGVFVVGVEQRSNTWILHLTGGGQVDAGRVLLWE